MKEKTTKIIWYSVVAVIAIGLFTLIGVYAYKHRVVESKAYDVVATIDDKEHIPEYVTKTVYKDSDGHRRTRRHKHPARYIITYTVTFDGGIYGGNKQDVSKNLYESKKVGDEIPATFTKEWHADGEETYTIKLK